VTIATFPIAHRGFGLIEFETDKRLLWVQAVWKRFFSPKNCTQPGAMGLDATV
jgi:hypothetical protein